MSIGSGRPLYIVGITSTPDLVLCGVTERIALLGEAGEAGEARDLLRLNLEGIRALDFDKDLDRLGRNRDLMFIDSLFCFITTQHNYLATQS